MPSAGCGGPAEGPAERLAQSPMPAPPAAPLRCWSRAMRGPGGCSGCLAPSLGVLSGGLSRGRLGTGAGTLALSFCLAAPRSFPVRVQSCRPSGRVGGYPRHSPRTPPGPRCPWMLMERLWAFPTAAFPERKRRLQACQDLCSQRGAATWSGRPAASSRQRLSSAPQPACKLSLTPEPPSLPLPVRGPPPCPPAPTSRNQEPGSPTQTSSGVDGRKSQTPNFRCQGQWLWLLGL